MPRKDLDKYKQQQHESYLRNKDKVREGVKDRRTKTKKFLDEYKAGLECKFCGENDSVCLDFHHRDPSAKEFNISQVHAKIIPVDRLMEEINKCDVLCSNCHRKLHAGHIILE